jgi:ribosomal protein S18 acetylase RimI-like enzyme
MGIIYQPLEPHQHQQFLDWRSRGDPYVLELLQKELLRLEFGTQRIFVASHDGQLIGTVQLVLSRLDLSLEFADGKENAYIQALEVNLEYRRQGIGKGLMERLEAAARAVNFKRLTLMVELDNTAAIGLYQALGYSEFKRSSWTWKGVKYPTSCLEKWL